MNRRGINPAAMEPLSVSRRVLSHSGSDTAVVILLVVMVILLLVVIAPVLAEEFGAASASATPTDR